MKRKFVIMDYLDMCFLRAWCDCDHSLIKCDHTMPTLYPNGFQLNDKMA